MSQPLKIIKIAIATKILQPLIKYLKQMTEQIQSSDQGNWVTDQFSQVASITTQKDNEETKEVLNFQS